MSRITNLLAYVKFWLDNPGWNEKSLQELENSEVK